MTNKLGKVYSCHWTFTMFYHPLNGLKKTIVTSKMNVTPERFKWLILFVNLPSELVTVMVVK